MGHLFALKQLSVVSVTETVVEEGTQKIFQHCSCPGHQLKTVFHLTHENISAIQQPFLLLYYRDTIKWLCEIHFHDLFAKRNIRLTYSKIQLTVLTQKIITLLNQQNYVKPRWCELVIF